jgi:hypothetical protein
LVLLLLRPAGLVVLVLVHVVVFAHGSSFRRGWRTGPAPDRSRGS